MSSNLNGLLFLMGLSLCVAGVGQWSRPLAAVVAGAVLMALSVAKYLPKGKE